ncbi:hypothetical protein HJC23_001731 [Cyclotella cryptica]|uniref:PWI domain-containing protein n=1 Tax=Cyclotella cryptica TaxID=29204 RepID=A0ABD3QPN3_9STRA|eukprot:CCRYP_003266-RA/>CCRYP_003266-RA protein AED:0.14 eAED:0.14 QI:0/-1/0/1/-1/1/1/0/361
MPTIKGTASISSTSALNKLLRTTPFPPHFSTKVDTTKLHRGVLSHWIEQRIEEILGFEDEIVSSTATNLFLPEGSEDGKVMEVDPRKAQLDLVGFLGEKESAEFASELWEMMIDGANRKSGIPLILVEKKKEEMKRAREEQIRGSGGIHQGRGQVKRGVAGGDPEMNAFVREAARRAEMARAALANNNNNHAAGAGRQGAPEAEGPMAVPPSPSPPRERRKDNGRFKETNEYAKKNDYYIDRRGKLDEFGRRRGERPSQDDRKPGARSQQRKRSASPSRSRSRSLSSSRSRSYSCSSASYSVSPSPKKEHQRQDRSSSDRHRHGEKRRSDDRRRSGNRHRSRSISSDEGRNSRRDKKDGRR